MRFIAAAAVSGDKASGGPISTSTKSPSTDLQFSQGPSGQTPVETVVAFETGATHELDIEIVANIDNVGCMVGRLQKFQATFKQSR
ncbi:hypothetical protein KI688_008527 [Linnemannia hyalina]|uniref:Uncharacterized protein n=1 Tax=Linnemannia hyalina TaxID=64524 RepID=A0A9P7Y0H6_9FUNG|nr:hypothetical protein KI688_008527 [Linnemannia hyalina]